MKKPPDNITHLRPKGSVANEAPSPADFDYASSLQPVGMNEAQKAVWDDLAPRLSKLGRLDPLFVLNLEDYCYLVAMSHELREKLDREGWYYESNGRNGCQKKVRPEVAILSDFSRQIKFHIDGFGLTPTANSKLDKSVTIELTEYDDL